MRRIFVALFVTVILCGCGPSAPKSAGGPPVMRRLTEDQYRRIIADIFGEGIVIGGRFDPINRTYGLVSVGAGATAINGSAFERYDAIGRAVAAQVVDPKNRDVLIPCKPADATSADDACISRFFKNVGRLLYRRPLKEAELEAQVALARESTAAFKDFYDGLAASLSAMLVRPEFLFITDAVEQDPAHPGAFRLTPYAKAARLSFLLWNSTPDDILLTAAEKGELEGAGLAHQVDRLMTSSRLTNGVRALFTDMLGLDAFDSLQKDPIIYPAFGLAASDDAREQLLRTVTDRLLIEHGDYRTLFTSRKTVMSDALGLIYRMPIAQPDGWAPYEFPAGDEHVGVQSLVGFVALYSHPGRSSATLRGKAIREILMCEKVPDPPANVDFTLVSDSHNPVYKTARERLGAHTTTASCAGCHKMIDPVGLALENFDGAGQWRTTENDAPIDTTGELDGVAYRDEAGLGKALAADKAVTSCLVNRAYTYGVGRPAAPAEKAWLAYLERRFAKDDYRLPKLLRTIALSDAFYAVSPQQPAAPSRTASIR